MAGLTLTIRDDDAGVGVRLRLEAGRPGQHERVELWHTPLANLRLACARLSPAEKEATLSALLSGVQTAAYAAEDSTSSTVRFLLTGITIPRGQAATSAARAGRLQQLTREAAAGLLAAARAA